MKQSGLRGCDFTARGYLEVGPVQLTNRDGRPATQPHPPRRRPSRHLKRALGSLRLIPFSFMWRIAIGAVNARAKCLDRLRLRHLAVDMQPAAAGGEALRIPFAPELILLAAAPAHGLRGDEGEDERAPQHVHKVALADLGERDQLRDERVEHPRQRAGGGAAAELLAHLGEARVKEPAHTRS